MAVDRQARDVLVYGVVQGVGFRPFVYRLARRLGLDGWVRNTAGDVTIHLEGSVAAIDAFVAALPAEAPPLARLERVHVLPAPMAGSYGFAIEGSGEVEGRFQPVPPDVATCPDCLREMRDPADRRFGYPFINCTNCGPRYTIIEGLPYDRPRTTMRSFPMCDLCRAEYENPDDRRFHAQPIACPVCGPHVWLESAAGSLRGDDATVIARAAEMLVAGRIVAVKGLGGFHLAADATSDAALMALRQRKQRPDKALALMMPDLDTVKRYCVVGGTAAEALEDPARPIVLLPVRPSGPRLSALVAPDHDTVGVMLPYTALHHLLMAAVGRPLVLTSGNLSEEPLAVSNEEARERLAGIADVFLMHDRPIHTPCDDSVMALEPDGRSTPALADEDRGQRLSPIRRARGYTPSPLRVELDGPQVLAVGPEMKCTACVVRDDLAFLSQHVGDLVNLETLEHYRRIVTDLESLFHVTPECVAHDLHPDYMSTEYALERAASLGVPAMGVQHHYAHALSCLADVGVDSRDGPVLAVVFDGTGYGEDGCIWGGEWLLIDGGAHRRLAHLQYLPLAGAEAAIRHVDRLACGYLAAVGVGETSFRLPSLAHLSDMDVRMVRAALQSPATPLTSSMGRLFDAVSALLGLCRTATYEAQAAIRLETAARLAPAAGAPFAWSLSDGGEVLVGELLLQVVEAARRGEAAAVVARRFHETVAEMVGDVCLRHAETAGAKRVALSGGCFQNVLLATLCERALWQRGLQPLVHTRVPCNDGGVALGQAVAARLALAGAA